MESSVNTTNRLGTIPAYKLITLLKVLIDLDKLKYIWKNQIPKPPRMTKHKAWWSIMIWMWFFEQGPNPIYFSKDSPQSQDLANSFSVKELLAAYKKQVKFLTNGNSRDPRLQNMNLVNLNGLSGLTRSEISKLTRKSTLFLLQHIISSPLVFSPY